MRSTSERERRRLASVASEYEDRGYEVKVQPTAAELPDFIVGFETDLFATGNGEFVVIKVEPRNEVENNREVAAIEAAVRNRPGWRFEPIIDGLDSEDGRLLGPHRIETSLEEANELETWSCRCRPAAIVVRDRGNPTVIGSPRRSRTGVSGTGIHDKAPIHARPSWTGSISDSG